MTNQKLLVAKLILVLQIRITNASATTDSSNNSANKNNSSSSATTLQHKDRVPADLDGDYSNGITISGSIISAGTADSATVVQTYQKQETFIL